ncbi:MAG: hypothetical protein QM679_08775 [Patulibacter sp.]
MLVAIDVDSTLHDYWGQFRAAAIELHGVDLPYEQQTDWTVDRLTRTQLADVIQRTHDDERIAQATPYPDAADIINGWRRAGHFVLITTHRRPDAHDATADWLSTHRIGFDLLRCGYQKVDHCQQVGADVLIDDSPTNLLHALAAGMTPATLRHPWNATVTAEHPAIIAGDDWNALALALATELPRLDLRHDIAPRSTP